MNHVPRVLLVSLFAAACGGSTEDAAPESAPQSTSAPPVATVTIVSPIEGSFQEETNVVVVLRSTVLIVPAGDMTPGTGHHHLYLDADLGDPTVPVPADPGRIVHLGDGSNTYTFENVRSGGHRLIAIVADGAHIPLQPLVADTVEFVVE
ncbi:MAG: DUF4399 domain-containing protein [Gemmatimonadetes bacterium]|nr:DUF4399 domain-containing protein [Gemmatimonadota bacterium]